MRVRKDAAWLGLIVLTIALAAAVAGPEPPGPAPATSSTPSPIAAAKDFRTVANRGIRLATFNQEKGYALVLDLARGTYRLGLETCISRDPLSTGRYEIEGSRLTLIAADRARLTYTILQRNWPHPSPWEPPDIRPRYVLTWKDGSVPKKHFRHEPLVEVRTTAPE